jgi:lipid A 3-O-deacylase
LSRLNGRGLQAIGIADERGWRSAAPLRKRIIVRGDAGTGRLRLKLVMIFCAVLAMAVVPSAARADELFAGVAKHDVKTPLDLSGIESGMDVSLGYRAGAIGHLFTAELEPYIFGALNTAGNTDYAAAGIEAKFRLGNRLYFRPGLGIAIHDGSAGKYYRTDRIAFGSRVLFEPEIAVGVQVSRRFSLEASWVHMSHAQLFGKENPGIDNLGVRLNFKL